MMRNLRLRRWGKLAAAAALVVGLAFAGRWAWVAARAYPYLQHAATGPGDAAARQKLAHDLSDVFRGMGQEPTQSKGLAALEALENPLLTDASRTGVWEGLPLTMLGLNNLTKAHEIFGEYEAVRSAEASPAMSAYRAGGVYGTISLGTWDATPKLLLGLGPEEGPPEVAGFRYRFSATVPRADGTGALPWAEREGVVTRQPDLQVIDLGPLPVRPPGARIIHVAVDVTLSAVRAEPAGPTTGAAVAAPPVRLVYLYAVGRQADGEYVWMALDVIREGAVNGRYAALTDLVRQTLVNERDRQRDAAQAALPKLEGLVGQPFPYGELVFEPLPQELKVKLRRPVESPLAIDGKVRLISLGATWCPPCQAEQKQLDALQRTFGAGKLEVVSVELVGEGPGPAETFRDVTAESTFAFGRMRSGRGQRFRAYRIPTTFLVDAKGTVVWAGTAELPGRSAIREALAGE